MTESLVIGEPARLASLANDDAESRFRWEAGSTYVESLPFGGRGLLPRRATPILPDWLLEARRRRTTRVAH